MASSICAVTISREPVTAPLCVPRVQLNGRTFGNAADVQAAWFDSVALVETDYFFWLDSDDELPPDAPEILTRCQDAPITYTDESVRGERRVAGPYRRAEHLQRPLQLHHLVVCHTASARAVLARLPRGHYWPELLLFWVVARAGAKYLPSIGYIWHKSLRGGLHRQPFTGPAMMRSVLWCRDNP